MNKGLRIIIAEEASDKKREFFYKGGLKEFVSHLNVPIPGRFDELLLGALAYMLVLWGTFRLGRTSLAILAGSHFILWLIVYIGNMLYSQAQLASTAS